MIKTYYPEEMLIQQLQDGDINHLEYIQRHSSEWEGLFNQFCKDNSLTASEEAAIKFIESMDAMFEESLEAGEV